MQNEPNQHPGGKPPFMKPCKEISYEDLGNGIYVFTAPPIGNHQYLIVGTEKALLIDTGFGIGSLKEKIEEITTLPLILVNTHGHPDHCGGNAEFNVTPLVHPLDFEAYRENASYQARYDEISHMPEADEFLTKLCPAPQTPAAIEDGAVLDLGGRKVTVILVQGHTRGNIALFDEQTHALFGGDNLQSMCNLGEKWASGMEEFVTGLKKLKKLPVAKIYNGHNPMQAGPEWIDSKLSMAQRYLSGDKGSPQRARGGMLMGYSQQLTVGDHTESSMLLYNPEYLS
jgi:glyoxylase-like metal-dependent hydrolase (beta-lactamase superfamily II)